MESSENDFYYNIKIGNLCCLDNSLRTKEDGSHELPMFYGRLAHGLEQEQLQKMADEGISHPIQIKLSDNGSLGDGFFFELVAPALFGEGDEGYGEVLLGFGLTQPGMEALIAGLQAITRLREIEAKALAEDREKE